MKDIKITFVGGGHMGRALIGGLIAGGTAPQNITVADPDDSQRSALEQDLEVNTNADSAAAVNGADIAVLAVKPQIMDAVLERSEEHTSELQSRGHLVCRLLLENK